MIKPRVKICCISSLDEAKVAVNYGASALGLVSNMPSGPGVIDDNLIRTIAQTIPPPIATFLLTSETSSEKIITQIKFAQTNTVQIVDLPELNVYQDIRKLLPWIKIVQVVHVVDHQSIDEAIAISEQVDALLLDSGNPNLEVKELGGTGRVHNWEISKEIVRQSKVPVFLAGGLSADNIKRAVSEVQPFGVDLCSGVRTNGKLDEFKLGSFFRELNGLF